MLDVFFSFYQLLHLWSKTKTNPGQFKTGGREGMKAIYLSKDVEGGYPDYRRRRV
jgi:hypothetical protein